MRVVDARSGKTLTVGQRVDRGRGEWIQLLDVRPGILSASATVARAYRDMRYARELPGSCHVTAITDVDKGVIYPTEQWAIDPESAPLVEDIITLPLLVRFTHPTYFLEHVGFINS